MDDSQKSKEQLIKELEELRRRVVEYHRAEMDQSDSQASYRLLVKNVQAGLVVVDYEGKFLFVNDISAEAMGCKPAEIKGKYHKDFFPPDIDKRQMQNIRRVIETGEIYSEEAKTFLNDQWRHYDVSLQPYLDREGKTIAALIIAYDVTTRVNAERALREKEENYKILFDSSPDSIIIIDLEGTIIDCNKASEKVTGEPSERAMGKKFYDFGGLPEEDVDIYLQLLKRAGRGEDVGPLEMRFVMNGQMRWLEAFPTLLKRDGNVVAIQVISRDITDRKISENTLIESEQRYRDLVEKAGIAILVDDIDGRLVYFNEKFCQLFGYTNEEMNALSVEALIHPDDFQRIQKYHDDRFRGNDTITRFEFRGVKKNGSTIYLDIEVTALKKDGKIVGTRSFIWDITERKLAVEALKQSEQFSRAVIENSPLGISVRSRTGQLLSFNSVWKRLWGHTTEDLEKQLHAVRKELKFDQRDDYLGPWKEKVREVYENGGHLFIPDVKFENHPTGKPLWLSQYFYALKNEVNEVDRVVIMTEDITERKAAEQALFESEENYRALVEQANDGIVVVQEGRIRFVNSYLAKLLGYRVDEIIGGQYTNYIHPEELEEVVENYRRRMNIEPVPSFYDSALIRKDGSRLEVEFSARLTKYNGAPADLAFVRDITDRRAAAAALRESEKKFRELTDLLPQTVFEIDTEARLTFTNQYGLESFGYTEEDVASGLNVINMFLPEDIERLKENIAKTLAGVISEDREYDMIRKDGSIFPVLIYSAPVIQGDKAVGLRGVVVDITERKKFEKEIQKHRDHLEELVNERSSELLVANEQLRREIIERKRTEEQVRESGEKYRVLFETTGEGILIADYEAHKFRYANPAICNLLGYTEKELIGMGVDDIHPKDKLEYIHEEFERNSTRPDYIAVDTPCLKKDGTIVYVDIAGATLYIDGIRCSVGFFRDTTERVKTHNALRESEERFRLLAELSPDAISIIQDGKIKFMNKAALKMYGAEGQDDIIGRNVFDSIHPDSHEIMTERMQEALDKNRPTDFIEEKVVVAVDRFGYVESAYAPFEYEGRPAIQVVARDITERKRIEEALSDSELQYRSTIDSMGDSIHVINRDFKIILCNKALQEWHKKIGLDPNVLDRKLFEVYSFLPDKVRDEYELVFETGETHMSIETTDLSSGRFITETRKIPINDGDEVVRVVTVLHDITERMQAEEALKESEAWMRSTIESLPFDFFAINEEGRYILQNSVCRDHWGDLIGKKPEELDMDEDIRQIWLENNRRALAGETVNGEVDYIIDGEPGYFYNVVAPIQVGGKIKGLMGVNMDITDLRKTESELRKATEELSSEREALEAKNIALKEVLGQIEDEKKALKLQIAANVDRVILPAIQRLRENCEDRVRKHVDNLESSLKTISAPFIEQLRTDYSQLTPRELEVCKMIKNGMMSKEISEILNVSILTVHKHREMIRKKLGIKNKNVNLGSFLQSF